jgi:DNA-binding transcriptional LysR family regulator
MHECIAYRSPSTGRIVKWEFGGDVPESYEPHAVLTLNDIFGVCDAAIAGHGLAQLPTFIATPPIRNGELVPVFVDRASAPAHLVLQYPARPLTPARVRGRRLSIREAARSSGLDVRSVPDRIGASLPRAGRSVRRNGGGGHGTRPRPNTS